ncbi:hypothetical protein DSO57_1035582 [Entomophthora muscae]|uniref:Uncharacterized protein n=1 Tax=Entomophthora muscae TaxID=34485 RepID=A0ACC2UJC8_9FUNG|nr:hypothetical protein DSO57_1035582 [Entomophthora muscae]
MQFITLAIVTALVGASPIPAASGNKNRLVWTLSSNNRQAGNRLRAAQDGEAANEEVGPLGIQSNLEVFEDGKDEPTAQICYQDCGDNYSGAESGSDDRSGDDSNYEKPDSAVGGGNDDSYSEENDSDSDSDSDSDDAEDNYSGANEGGYSPKGYNAAGAGRSSYSKGYKGAGLGGSSYKNAGDSDSDSSSDSDSDDDKYSGSKGARSYSSKPYNAVGGEGNSRGMAYYSNKGAGENSYKKAGDSSSDSSSDSDSDDDNYSGSKGGSAYAPKGYNAAGAGRSSRSKAYNGAGSGGKPYKKGGDSSSDSSSDSDSDDDKYSAAKGGSAYSPKAYNAAGAEYSSYGKAYKGASVGSDSYKKAGDSDSDSDSDSSSDSDSNDDKYSGSKGAKSYSTKPYNAVGGKDNSRGNTYYSDAGAGGNSYKKGGDSSSDSSSDSDSNNDDKYSGSKGGRGYGAKAYSSVGGEGNSHGKAYKSAGGSYQKGTDSDSDSSSSSDSEEDKDSQGKPYKSGGKNLY